MKNKLAEILLWRIPCNCWHASFSLNHQTYQISATNNAKETKLRKRADVRCKMTDHENEHQMTDQEHKMTDQGHKMTDHEHIMTDQGHKMTDCKHKMT